MNQILDIKSTKIVHVVHPGSLISEIEFCSLSRSTSHASIPGLVLPCPCWLFVRVETADGIKDIWQAAYRARFYRGGPVLMARAHPPSVVTPFH